MLSDADVQAAFFVALSANDVAGAAQGLADNVLFLFPALPPAHGKAATVRALRHLRARFVDIAWTHRTSLDAAPDWRIATWTVAGTRRDGSTLRAEVASLMRLDRDGRIAYLSDYFKSRDLCRPGAPAASLDGARRLGSF